MKMPRWCLPRLGDAVPDFETARARLGQQALNAKMTDRQRKARGRKSAKTRLRTMTQERRSEIAAGAARAANAKLTAKEMADRGKDLQRAFMEKTTPEQRKAWASAAGKAGAAARWAA